MHISDVIQVDNNRAIVVDNWYEDAEYENVFQECLFASTYLKDPVTSGSATDINNNILKNNRALFIHELFAQFDTSIIGRLSYKLYNENLNNALYDIDPIYHYLRTSNSHGCLISYYEESNYYKAHRDKSVITMVTWLYENPKAFQGGSLLLRDKDNNLVKEIECIANRSVIFPSFMYHEVTNISMDKKDTEKNKGRFTISQFSNIV